MFLVSGANEISCIILLLARLLLLLIYYDAHLRVSTTTFANGAFEL